MLNWLAKRAKRKRNAHDIYGSIVTLSRAPALYSELAVPDELEARFEVLMLHVFLFVNRVQHEEADTRALAQEIVDLFFADLDTTSREVGVGDMVVPKKMRNLANVYHDRMTQYGKAFKADDRHALSKEFKQVVYHDGESAERHAAKLTDYAWALMQELAERPLGELHSAHERFGERQG